MDPSDISGNLLVTGSILLFFFSLFLLILWTILPFAIFGTKPRLDLIAEGNAKVASKLDQLNANISGLRAELRVAAEPPSPPPLAEPESPSPPTPPADPPPKPRWR